MTVLLADVVLMPLYGGLVITFLLQKHTAAQAFLLSTQVFKTSILRRDGERVLKKKKKLKKGRKEGKRSERKEERGWGGGERTWGGSNEQASIQPNSAKPTGQLREEELSETSST